MSSQLSRAEIVSIVGAASNLSMLATAAAAAVVSDISLLQTLLAPQAHFLDAVSCPLRLVRMDL